MFAGFGAVTNSDRLSSLETAKYGTVKTVLFSALKGIHFYFSCHLNLCPRMLLPSAEEGCGRNVILDPIKCKKDAIAPLQTA